MWKIIFAVGLAFVFYPGSDGYPKTFRYASPQNAVYEDFRNFPARNTDNAAEMQGYDQIRNLKAALEALIGIGFDRIRRNDDNPCDGRNKIYEPRCMVRRTLNSLVLGGSFKRADPNFVKNEELFENEMEKGN